MPSSASRLRCAEFVGERPLHDRECGLGPADLVVPSARRDDPRGVLRPLAEGDDVRREAANRTQHHAPQRRPQHARDQRRLESKNVRKLRETRHNPSIKGVSSNVTSIVAGSGAPGEASFTILPGEAKSAWKVAPMLSR